MRCVGCLHFTNMPCKKLRLGELFWVVSYNTIIDCLNIITFLIYDKINLKNSLLNKGITCDEFDRRSTHAIRMSDAEYQFLTVGYIIINN